MIPSWLDVGRAKKGEGLACFSCVIRCARQATRKVNAPFVDGSFSLQLFGRSFYSQPRLDTFVGGACKRWVGR